MWILYLEYLKSDLYFMQHTDMYETQRMACSKWPVKEVPELRIEPQTLETQCVSASVIWVAKIYQKRKFERRYTFAMFTT